MYRVFALLILAGCTADRPQQSASSLSPGWNRIAGAGQTTCSDGSAYHFFVRPGNNNKLLVFFQGGGACWSGETCDTDLEPTYKVNLDTVDPAQSDGIFDFNNKRNPFQNHSVVFASYCTGDVHIGNRTVTYKAVASPEHPSHQFTIEHRGAVNSEAVLDWVYAHFAAPDAIFVTGSSAGSIPTPFYTVQLAEHYPSAKIAQLGDGSGGYRGTSEMVPQEIWGAMDIVADWPEYTDFAVADFTFEHLYISAAGRYPQITFAAFDTAEDQVQKRYLELRDLAPASLLANIEANQADIRAEVDNFRAYIAGGEMHTILRRPEFYRYHVDGVRVSDWIADLAITGDVENVHCSDCATPQIIPEKMEDL